MTGDGTWEKRGYTSLYGVTSLIGYYYGKILDICVKSAYCKQCEVWNEKMHSSEYQGWYESHEESCSANHSSSSGKMEVDAVIEMFKRSVEEFGIVYKNYISDGNSKSFTGLLKSPLYGSLEICKKDCIGHMNTPRRRMKEWLGDSIKSKFWRLPKEWRVYCMALV